MILFIFFRESKDVPGYKEKKEKGVILSLPSQEIQNRLLATSF